MEDSNDQLVLFLNEVTILKNLDHQRIVKFIEYGQAGTLIHPSGHSRHDIAYIVMEYVEHSLFDFCKVMGGMGEEAGKIFLRQLIDVLEHIHGAGVAHRDLKLENVLIDNKLNLKLLDFGLASQKNIGQLHE